MLCERCGSTIPSYESFCPSCGALKQVYEPVPVEAATVTDVVTYVPSDKPSLQEPPAVAVPELPYVWGKFSAICQIVVGSGICLLGPVLLLSIGADSIEEEAALGLLALLLFGGFTIWSGWALYNKRRWALYFIYASAGMSVLNVFKQAVGGDVIPAFAGMVATILNTYYFYKRSDEFS